MNSFEQAGAAQLMAYEGQLVIARSIAAAINRAFLDILGMLGRHLPGNDRP